MRRKLRGTSRAARLASGARASGAGQAAGLVRRWSLLGVVMRGWFNVPQHAYRVQLSGLSVKSREHYRRVGGLVVLAVGPESAKRVGIRAFRLTHSLASKSETRGVRVTGVVDLGHRGTDGDRCPICKGEPLPAGLFTGAE